ncbi:MAG: glycoside hydrolase family 99-like domain-containing protein [Comamonas sp.]|nr:glycoside hydrolase family 99-like domain-containing protein [Comamonas sp.]
MDKVDITDMRSSYADGSFDFIICSHVLEHVQDDRAAMRELCRVLAPEGRAILMVPILLTQAHTDEDPALDDIKERVRRFGQEDHVRRYAKWDFLKRLRDSGFLVEMLDESKFQELTRVPRVFKNHGITSTSLLYIGKKYEKQEDVKENDIANNRRWDGINLDQKCQVTIAIPAYKAVFFAEALDSALSQRFGSFEVLVCDDSGGREIEDIVISRQNGLVPLRYIRNETRLGERGNVRRCIDEARGYYIKLLYDDDLIAPDCIARLSEVLSILPEVSLVSSRRGVINERGELASSISSPAYRWPFLEDVRLKGTSVCSFLGLNPINFIGEPSSVMFRKEDVERTIQGDVFSLAGLPISWVGDLALYVNLLKNGDLVMLAETLSNFRVSSYQVSQKYRDDATIVHKHVLQFQTLVQGLEKFDRNQALLCAPMSSEDQFSELDLMHYWDGRIQQARLRVLAFYLPQFHEIPENNAWWGEGFTEWTNVRQAKPLFEGHEQPLVPGELGYYDLSSVDVLERQAKLAKEHGIHGFCFHYYWFDGKRLLEKPVDQLLRAPQIDLPFCLCWANENWTRRWDGGEQEVLMPQCYSPELHERFARDLLPYFLDRRYIRVQGKPVLLIYRTDIIPDLKDTVASWRDAWRALGLGEVYLVAVESFRAVDPHEWGFDACCDFPPHQVNPQAIAPQSPVNLVADTQAHVGDYGRLRDFWLGRPPPGYKRFCGLVPGWDNSARRRKGGATLFVDATPERYRTWLREAVARTVNEFEGDERLVFINAWNEWAEGCVLEPTQRWGRAYLEATRDVLRLPQQEFLRPVSSPYQQWLDGRLDCIKEISLYLAAGVHIQVLIAGGDAVAITRTRAALDAQQRAPDRVLTLSEDGLTALGEEGWTLLLHAGDTLETDALARLHLLLGEPEAEGACVVYFDHDELDAEGQLTTPYFKPDFNHDLLLSYPYVGRALAVRNDWALPLLAGQGDGPFDLALAYRLALSAAAEGGARALRHIAAPLLHLTSEQPTVFCTTSEAWQALAGVLAEHLARAEPGSEVTEGPAPGTFHVIPPLPRTPLVSIVIPTRDQLPFLSRCIESLLEKTNYPNFEVLVVDNGSQTPEAREFLAGLAQVDPARIRVLAAPGAFNFSRMNNLAVKQARGEFILLLNNDTAALQPDWLTMMVRHALRPGVGIVGARLLYPDGSLQHAGIIMGLRGPAEHPALGAPADQVGYLFRTQVQQDFSAVTAACLLVGKAVYEEVGGLDEQAFAVSYNDVDFCLRVGATGRRIVWTPLATLLHEGSASQKRSIENLGQVGKQARFTREQGALYERWPDVIARDPAYNPNLSLTERGYEIEFNALLRPAPPRVAGRPHALVFPGDTQGCGHYRLIQPLDAMVQARLATGRVSLSSMRAHLALASGADVLVFQRCFTDAGLQALQELRSLKQVRKVYDADDLDSRIRITNASYRQTLKDARGRMAKAIGLCDRLVVSTQPLAQALSGTSDDIRVVANRLAPGMWGVEPPKRDIGRPRRKGKPRVGWAGSTSHYGDLKMIADVIRDLADEVDWVFMGMCPEEIRPYVKEFYAGVPTLEWPRHLMAQDWDLAIAPLESHAFNECKSNLKLLEYGWCAMPVVCSDVAPYQGDLPVVRVKNRHKDWCDAIRATLADGTQARAQGLALQRKVHSDWVLEGEHVSEWLAAWAS